jgi:hypothetical protein
MAHLPQDVMHLAAGLLVCGTVPSCAGGADSRLSDDLTSAQLRPVEWQNDAGEIVPGDSAMGTSHRCPIRFLDERTGIQYVLQQSRAVAPPGEQPEATGPWQGDYLRVGTEPQVGPASHWVRIDCETWKVLELVRRGG